MSIWSLGEGSGIPGRSLDVNRITCAFCEETGIFETVHHAEKKKPGSSKTLNFDTLKCGNCAGYVMVLWSATSEVRHPSKLSYDFRVLPAPQRIIGHPEHWPEPVGRYWKQAHSNISAENWDAAALMARSALQYILREHGAEGSSLKAEVTDLANKGELPPVMRDWAHEVRELGNEAAHPQVGGAPTGAEDARDVVEFLGHLITYLYDLPHDIEQYRTRKMLDPADADREASPKPD